jgi:ankyrin repeat protein
LHNGARTAQTRDYPQLDDNGNNVVDNNNNNVMEQATPLQQAIWYHQWDIARLLLHYGADASHQDALGRTAAHTLEVELAHIMANPNLPIYQTRPSVQFINLVWRLSGGDNLAPDQTGLDVTQRHTQVYNVVYRLRRNLLRRDSGDNEDWVLQGEPPNPPPQ